MFTMGEKLVFKNDGGDKLYGIISNPSGIKTNPVIIFCHGFGSSMWSKKYVNFEKILNENNISTFRFDFFAHGESEGKFEEITVSEAVNDIENAISFLKGLGYSRFGLVGSSFGGLASIIVASKTSDLYLLCLISPVSDYFEIIERDIGRGGIQEWKDNGFHEYWRKYRLNYSFVEDAKNNIAYKVASRIRIPTLIVHRDKDEVVPFEQSIKISSLIKNSRLEIVIGRGHPYSTKKDFDYMINLVSKFIVEVSLKHRF